MKFKLLAKLMQKLLRMTGNGNGERKEDMYLDDHVLAGGGVMILMAIAASVAFVFYQHIALPICGAALLVIGIFALLCWRNQSAVMLDDESFSYKTMFGKTTVYYFRDIVSLRRSRDSMTLILKGGKVHIESVAIISERFKNAINAELAVRRYNT
jgi:hypothetical protein